jgi:hydrogenase nickel incorporation protein HypA/HybF
MHEMSIAQGILDIVCQHVPPADHDQVGDVVVRVGRLSGVIPESLEFCFSGLVAGTGLAGARLAIEHVPTVCHCPDCDRRFDAESLIFLCPACGSGRARLVSGDDLQVVSIELDAEHEASP